MPKIALGTLDLNVRNNADRTPLAVALTDRASALALLAVPQVDVDVIVNEGGDRAIHVVARDVELLRLVLASTSVHVNAENSRSGARAIHLVTDAACLELLLAVPGMDVNASDRSGCTALRAAYAAGNDAGLAMLVARAELDVNVPVDGEGNTLAHLCGEGVGSARRIRGDALVRQILSHVRLDVNRTNRAGTMTARENQPSANGLQNNTNRDRATGQFWPTGTWKPQATRKQSSRAVTRQPRLRERIAPFTARQKHGNHEP